MDQETIDTLKKARELISDPKRWNQGAYAIDESGEGLRRNGACGLDAVAWCAIGAIAKVVGQWSIMDPRIKKPWEALELDAKVTGDVTGYNDDATTTHADILALFDRTIASLEKGD